MTRKYDIRICSCGVIHAIPVEKVNKAIKHNKELILMCGSCGKAIRIGADEDMDYDGNPCYMMYTRDFTYQQTESITKDSFKDVEEIFYDIGYKVPMMTGQNATDYIFGHFSDRWYPDFYKIERNDITVPEIMKFIETYKKERCTVNMDRFINTTPDDVLEDLSSYLIEGLDWTGTKYERRF